MGYACYERGGRDQGYGVPAKCDHPNCNAGIDRGMGHACGGDPIKNCGLFFCSHHLAYYGKDDVWTGPICERCADEDAPPFEAKPDTEEWILHKMTDASWAEWRDKNPEFVKLHIKFMYADAASSLASNLEET